MLRLLSAVEGPWPAAGVCRRPFCGGVAVGRLGFCVGCERLHEADLERLRARRERVMGEIEERFPGLVAALTVEHAAALPAHLAAHYRPGDDWRFVLAALHDAWTETLERLAERAAGAEA